MQYIDNQINTYSFIMIDTKKVSVRYKLLFIMIDGKICNAISSNASIQKYYLCGAIAQDFN